MTSVVDWGRAILAERWRDLAVVATPVFVFFFVRSSPDVVLQRSIVLVLAAVALTFLAARPGLAAVGLIGGFAVMEVVLPLLFKAGAPLPVVRNLGLWKEGFVAALVAAAFRHRRREPKSPDAIDRLAAAFVVLVAGYWLLPGILPPDPSPTVGEAREVAFRSLVLPVIGLVAVRHAGISAVWRRRCLGAALLVGVLLGAAGIAEMLAPRWWDTFLSRTIGLLTYRQAAFGDTRTTVLTFADFEASRSQRAGSLYADPLITGFTYHLPFAVALTAVIAKPRLRTLALVALPVTGLLLTQGRAAILGGVVIVAAALRRTEGQSATTRTNLGLALAGVAIVALPLLAGTALGTRVAGAVNGRDTISTPDHINSSRDALARVIDEPLGSGLGISGGISERFEVVDRVVSENHFLAIGIEVGVLGMTIYVLLLAATIRAGRRAHPDALAFAATSALLATAIGGLFLHSLESPVVSVPALVAAGLATVRPDVPAPVRRPPAGRLVHAR